MGWPVVTVTTLFSFLPPNPSPCSLARWPHTFMWSQAKLSSPFKSSQASHGLITGLGYSSKRERLLAAETEPTLSREEWKEGIRVTNLEAKTITGKTIYSWNPMGHLWFIQWHWWLNSQHPGPDMGRTLRRVEWGFCPLMCLPMLFSSHFCGLNKQDQHLLHRLFNGVTVFKSGRD